ncbi:MAG TPA: DeoR/GlpR family DNA-binding transcription regulator [Candidatus Acidoferrales bacterium]|nr:DeoR/GlpR family DNA-binding transcription regulator [Candidatus Acidoferrales bacterium]
MSARSDRQAARLKAIIQALQETGEVNVLGLRSRFNASIATIRRDLLQLESRGLLRRTHGGAVSIEPLFYEPFKRDSTFQDLIERFAQEKKRIGRAAASLVPAASGIALTPGTTTNEVVRNLPPDNDIRVTTNAVNIAMELSKRKDVNVFMVGGHLRGDWFSLVGSNAVENMRKTFVDIVFIGANAIDAATGLTCHNPEEAEVNRAMILQAKRKIAVADHSKLGKTAAWLICAIDEIDLLITDSGATDAQIAPFQAKGIEVKCV